MIDWSAALVLSASTVQVAWELAGLGETPWQLDPPRLGRTAQERDTIVAAARAELAGHDAGGLVDRLRILSAPDWSVDVRLRAETLVAGVGAGRRHRGLLAVRHGPEIALLDLPVLRVVPAALHLLGPISPGPGRAVRHPGDTDAELLAEMCSDVRMVAQIGATVSPRDGTRTVRRPRVIGFHRTTRGDYQTVPDSHGAACVEPADPSGLTSAVERLLATS